ncbi:SidA/IucD/PvdA family monooxygenase [Acinetobacter wanghuae]|uniref:SidA/IucD/PvdA family monooxygenase n=1 Tax=Acinetobacter wanghuae TaxID=2662362 RepID=A0A5Q0P217_9GAMM|nr:NAD(P)/FAD-dependent oxidoreductase [Acinetobacter wanghuae]MQW92719.1 SidA/IucD/PvdA family monooxygenase [Acinetobacter wanghuae]QGA10583.1 SidA/IucD/PvdA family monooxygenase [Acinetobacter wanghuae]
MEAQKQKNRQANAKNLADKKQANNTNQPQTKAHVEPLQAHQTQPKQEPSSPKQKATKSKIYDTIIIGAGISGLAAAHKMLEAGLDDFIVLEKAQSLGGTWRDNTYPGCGCDVPSALYSFSFAPSQQWNYLFARQPDILKYLNDVADTFQLKEKIAFEHSLLNAHWNEKESVWELQTSQGDYVAKTVIFATGPITEPQIPKIKGIETFKGEMFHSARWNHDAHLAGKRIAVIGTGASAIQFIPQIQPLAKHLYVLQRTAPWVLPKPDLAIRSQYKELLEKYPSIQKGWRHAVSQSLNLINLGLRHPKALEPVNYLSRQLLKLQVKDPVLRSAVTAKFSIGCKRLLFSNHYYPALQQPNTTLIDQGLVEIDGDTVVAANGERREVDVIIWGTGFEVSHPPIGRHVHNAQGIKLVDVWKDSSPEAFLGTSLAHMPNAFLVLGPNILLYDSFIGIAEAQVDYIVSGLLQMKQQQFKRFEIKPDVLRYHNVKVQANVKNTVFNTGGCQSYYLDQNGRNFAAWPWSLTTLKQRLKQLDLKHYDVI